MAGRVAVVNLVAAFVERRHLAAHAILSAYVMARRARRRLAGLAGNWKESGLQQAPPKFERLEGSDDELPRSGPRKRDRDGDCSRSLATLSAKS